MCKRKPTARYAYFARKARKRQTPSAMQVSNPYPSRCFRAISISFPRPNRQGSSSIKLLRKQKNPENRKTKDFVQAQEKITKSTP